MPSTEALTKETRVGATRQADGSWEFLLWAPQSRSVSLHLVRGKRAGADGTVSCGYHRAIVKTLEPGSEYFYQLEGERELPDPASRFQPKGVHGPSQIVDLEAFPWTDHGWKGPTLERSVFYELHVGTYTPEGTFDAVIGRLPELVAWA